MSTFDYRRNRRQQLVAKGEPVDNNISFDGKTNTDFLKYVCEQNERYKQSLSLTKVSWPV